MTYTPRTLDQHFKPEGTKRILTLDGGGIRGIVTLGYLKHIEDLLKKRHGNDDDFRLAHYFDLIAGTSTGAIIAAGLALGMSVDKLIELYLQLGDEVFYRSRWRKGILRARYSHEKLTEHLQSIMGAETTLGSSTLQTGLLVVTKRLDTGSAWPLGNNPKGAFYQAGPTDDWISNKDYPLWQVVRASTAAPAFFDPETIIIADQPGRKKQVGEFVDGGVSPHNNPTLQAFMYATLAGYNVGWQTGADKMLVISVGTGKAGLGKESTWITAKGAVQSLLSLMDDAGELVELMAQWLSTGDTHREIDMELGALESDHIRGQPCFTYARYNLSLTPDDVRKLKPGLSGDTIASLTEMDEPDNMPLLNTLADLDGSGKIKAEHFPAGFDLR